MRIAIIDNGKGAKELQKLLPNSMVVKPKDALKSAADAFILSDGDPNEENEKYNVEILDNAKKPVLAIGLGYLYLGALMGAEVEDCKPVNHKVELRLVHGSPITTALKKVMVHQEFSLKLASIPEDVLSIAATKDADIIQDVEKPFIGVNFRPELSPDGPAIMKNFLAFVEVYNQYHKQ
ncbi:MAG: hypothetical protein ABIG30_03045 [Candidatus Aenigmatarchaeota archaeon]